MATAQKKPISTDKSPKAQEATALLKADHKAVDLLFQQYEAARSSTKKKALASSLAKNKPIVSQICTELTVHAQIEEEIFYPPVQAELKDKELIPEAIVEHATLKDLIAQIEDGNPEDALYDAKVKVLSEYVKHHVKEEQNELFPKVKASKLDLYALGEQLAQRKEELMAKP